VLRKEAGWVGLEMGLIKMGEDGKIVCEVKGGIVL